MSDLVSIILMLNPCQQLKELNCGDREPHKELWGPSLQESPTPKNSNQKIRLSRGSLLCSSGVVHDTQNLHIGVNPDSATY